ncbi:MAG: corrinoid protein [Desulfopila sp.]
MAVKEIYEAVLIFNGPSVANLVEKEIEAGTDVSDILNNGLIGAMDEVGARFSAGDFFVPEMLMAARTMKAGLEKLAPHLAAGAATSRGTVVIGTVKGDLHDIGKNLVAMMMEGAGFKVIDLGVDVEPAAFLEAAQEQDAKVVALSALLTTTMPAMANTVKAFKEAGSSAKVIIGGAPVTLEFAEQIGADGYSESAPGAVDTARSLVA